MPIPAPLRIIACCTLMLVLRARATSPSWISLR